MFHQIVNNEKKRKISCSLIKKKKNAPWKIFSTPQKMGVCLSTNDVKMRFYDMILAADIGLLSI